MVTGGRARRKKTILRYSDVGRKMFRWKRGGGVADADYSVLIAALVPIRRHLESATARASFL